MMPGLPGVTYADGIRQLALPFALYMPGTVVLDVWDAALPSNAAVPAGQRFTNPEKTDSKIGVFLHAFDLVRTTLVLLYNPSTPFRCIIYHELLHACGESQEVRDIIDGVISHSTIGCEAITEMEAKLPS